MNIHLSLQSKGGAGKSTSIAFLGDYLKQKDLQTRFLDLDPNNATLAQYRALDVERIMLIDEHNVISTRGFDTVMETIETPTDVEHLVIDIGGDGFTQVVNHLVSHEFLERALDKGHSVTIHTPINGGQSLHATLQCLDNLAASFPDPATFCIWLVHRREPVATPDGKPFFEMKTYQRLQDRIRSVIDLKSHGTLFDEALVNVLGKSKTLTEALSDGGLRGDDAFRITKIRRSIWQQLDQALQ